MFSPGPCVGVAGWVRKHTTKNLVKVNKTYFIYLCYSNQKHFFLNYHADDKYNITKHKLEKKKMIEAENIFSLSSEAKRKETLEELFHCAVSGAEGVPFIIHSQNNLDDLCVRVWRWPKSALAQTGLKLWMKRSHTHWPDTLIIPQFLNNVLEMFLRDFLGSILERQDHTVTSKSMIQISQFTKSQRCFIRTTSGVCGVCFSSVIIMLKKWFELGGMAHYSAGSSHQRTGTVWDGQGQQHYSGTLLQVCCGI